MTSVRLWNPEVRGGGSARARAALIVAVGLLAAPTGLAGAQRTEAPATTTTTTTTATGDTTTSTTGPDVTTSTTLLPASEPFDTTTTTPSVVEPPPLTVDPLVPPVTDAFNATGEGAGGNELDPTGNYGAQAPFDMTSKSVLLPQLLAAQAALLDDQRQLTAAQLAATATEALQSDLAARVETSHAGSRRAIDDLAAARSLLRRRAVAAFVGGDPDPIALLGTFGRPADFAGASEYMHRLADDQRGAVRTLDQARSRLSDQDVVLAEQQSDLAGKVHAAHDLVAQISQVVFFQQMAVDALAAGSHIVVTGFTFPVTGPVDFSDTWGASRLAGTAQAHWHEGCDIMAPLGTALVAAETGVLSKVGANGLGGNSLSVTGVSGTRYYYAHLSTYAPGLVPGMAVTAGQVLGNVGNTGDAAGGPTHLHFEIHPGGGAAVDPFPLLHAAYVARSVAAGAQ